MSSQDRRGPKCYGEEDIAALIRTLDREEDHHIFAEDVIKTYPYLAQSYTKVCPRRCDLATAATKALDGAYSFDVKLSELRADIALMVSNCVAFNGPTSAYAEAAAKFERFALESIDRFVMEQNGGRRVSRLRLPPASAESPAQTAASPSPHSQPSALPAGGKRGAVVEAAAPAAPAFVLPQLREVVQLVDGLNRREDGNAFAVDVAAAYPDLKASYEKVCPVPMNLRLMHQRAKEGVYTAAASSPLFGESVATSFATLRADVELLVRNCITFNAKVDSWVVLAHGFQAFAHRRIDDFVLRHAAALRGTQTGAELYAAAAGEDAEGAQPAVASVSTPQQQQQPASAASPTGADVALSASRRKRERPEERVSTTTARVSAAAAAASPVVAVVGEVTPQVCATPLQPSLVIPPRLRRRLILEHMRHTQLPLRRVGDTVVHSELHPVQESGVADVVTPETATTTTTIAATASAAHVLRLLRQSIAEFFAERRRRPDFNDAFAFSQQEESVYMAVHGVIADHFEHTAAHLVLYERESAELAEWAALCGLQRATTAVPPERVEDSATVASSTSSGLLPRLSDTLHYLYLVRFLVHWPQLACLCCATTTPAAKSSGGGAAAPASLRISRDQLRAMGQVAVITQEFLNFVERVEEEQQQQGAEKHCEEA